MTNTGCSCCGGGGFQGCAATHTHPRQKYHSSPTGRRTLLVAWAVSLGLLCHSVAAAVVGTGLGQQLAIDDAGAGARWRQVLSTDYQLSRKNTFEQALTTTFNAKDMATINRTLTQYYGLVSWLQAHTHLNRTHLAFIPELHSETVQQVARSAVALASSSSKDSKALIAALADVMKRLSHASRWHGYPATRRLLVGTLLKKRMDFGGRFPADVQQAVDQVMLQLFRLHKQSAVVKGVVQFFHVSKSGGTNLCQSAEANGCATQGFDTRTNCLIKEFLDAPRWVAYNAHKYVQYRLSSRQLLPWFVNFHTFRPPMDCKARHAYLKQNGWDFYANEYTNPPGPGTTGEMCKEFVNLIMFRHPHDRLKSQLGWIQKLYREFYMEVDTQRAFVNRTAGFWERLMPAGANNYYTRSLLGQRFFEYPVVHITPMHVELAKLAALQHDVLLTLEAKDYSDVAMRVGLGWTHTLKNDTIRSSAHMGEAVNLPLDYQTLLAHNQPDVEVYDFAREMQALDTMLWNFISIADDELQILESNSTRCGYVSIYAPPAPLRPPPRADNATDAVNSTATIGSTTGTTGGSGIASTEEPDEDPADDEADGAAAADNAASSTDGSSNSTVEAALALRQQFNVAALSGKRHRATVITINRLSRQLRGVRAR